jgi:hypothetical protein
MKNTYHPLTHGFLSLFAGGWLAEHLRAYCNEMCFRFNNRKTPYLFRDTILRLIASGNLEYKQLTAA